VLPHSLSVSEGWNAVCEEEVGEESVTVVKAEVMEVGGKVIDCGEDEGASLFSVSSYGSRFNSSGGMC
jgi:hypothetical protein